MEKYSLYSRKPHTVRAKIFEKGDEDGFLKQNGVLGSIGKVEIPYIRTKEGKQLGKFGEYYILSHQAGIRELLTVSEFCKKYEHI